MCDFEAGFILCTCAEQRLQADNTPPLLVQPGQAPVYYWYLMPAPPPAAPDLNPEMIRGMSLNVEDLGQGLSSEWVLMNLNDHHCFDFAYTPGEGDMLAFFKEGAGYQHLSFVYQNGEWQEGEHLEKIARIIRRGVIGEA